MKSELLNYKPESIDYVLDDVVAETFPKELDFLSLELGETPLKTKRDVLNFVGKHFAATFPNDEFVTRKLTKTEEEAIRHEYCSLTEDLMPIRKAELEEAIEKAKKIKCDAEDALAAVMQDIATYAAQVKKGTKELLLKGKDTFCISLSGYYLVYTWDETKQVMVLANGYEIMDKSEIWASDEKNREAMLEFFGAEFEAAKRPESFLDGEMPFGDNLPD